MPIIPSRRRSNHPPQKRRDDPDLPNLQQPCADNLLHGLKSHNRFKTRVTNIINGAEATIRRDDDRIIKRRAPKAYRHEDIDTRLRKQRTKTEATILNKLKPTPSVHETKPYTIIMEYIDGTMLTDALPSDPSIMENVGNTITTVHDRNIYHGDLTTSNIIIGDDITIIDFGLGGHTDRAEDKAVDLYLLRKAIKSKHNTILDTAWHHFQNGYEPNDKDAIMQRFDEVKQRGRYK